MSNPTAAHTFDFTRIYESTRDNGAPGSGVWSVNTTIFDGSAGHTEGTTFSSGQLSDSDPNNGIIVANAANKLVFLGNGAPTVPILINVTGEGNIASQDFWDTTQGAWAHGSDFYIAYLSSTGGLKIAKSSDSGATWTKQDEGNGPSAITVALDATIQRVNNKICVCTWLDNGETDLAIWEFDMTTDLWSAVITQVASSLSRFSLSYRWTNGIFKFPNGDYLIVYITSTFGVGPMVCRRWTSSGNSWGPEVPLSGLDFANAIIDPDFNLVYIFTYETVSRSSTVHCSVFNHNTDTVSVDVTTFVNTAGGGSDGTGHPSIQNSKIFVPLDAAHDYANAVFVSPIPVGTFVKELLPVPAGEANTIDSFVVNPGGTGYVLNDTGTVSGGAAGYLATYRVDAVKNNAVASSSSTTPGTGYAVNDTVRVENGTTKPFIRVTGVGGGGAITSYIFTNLGAGCSVTSGIATTAISGVGTGFVINILSLFNGVTALTLTSAGGGYSLTSSAATATGGSQPGVGVGLTINILALIGKIPTCAYMTYPNGYSLNEYAIDVPLTLATTFAYAAVSIAIACPVTGATGKVGTFYSSAAPAVTGGTPPYVFTITGGSLPPGLAINSATGVISGFPTTAGSYSYTVTVTDSLSNSASVADPCPVVIGTPCAPTFIP